jgi:hypothetical protein
MLGFEVFSSWWQKATLRDVLLVIIGTIAVGWYFVSIIYLAFGHVRKPDEVDGRFLMSKETSDFMALSVTTISGTLATYLGLVIGFRQLETTQASNTALPESASISWLQAIAAYAYIASLLLALYLFVQDSNGSLHQTVKNLAISTLGILGGVMAVILNLKMK